MEFEIGPGVRARAGERVKCPVCGEEGVAAVDRFTAKGRVYYYVVVRHFKGDRVRRCVIRRYEPPREQPAPAQARAVEEFFRAAVEERRAVRGEEVARPQPQAPAPQPAAAPAVEEGAEGEAPPEAVARPVEVPPFKEFGPVPPSVDRAAWYVMKFVASWGSVRENPTEENFRRFVSTAHQVRERVGVEVADAVEAVERYVRAVREGAGEQAVAAAKADANDRVKRVVTRVIVANTEPFESYAESYVKVFAEEARKRVEEAVKRIEEAAKMPEVSVSREDYAAMFAVFRTKKRVEEEVRRRAYAKWEQIFAPGAKIVRVEG
jgi:hypothetical protein